MTRFSSRDVESLRALIQAFADEREWERFHSPRNLLLALVSEVGELADLVRWQGDQDPAIPAAKAQDWADEVADAAILLIRLADRTGVDLGPAIERKLGIAREKYPVDRFKGSCRKYDEG